MAASAHTTTPMMAQYLGIKEEYPDALLFYRMGDFYELFFDDAVQAASALGIALTKRGKHNGEDIQMCGVPFHAAEGYLLTLIRKGFRVAVGEQLESPAEAKKRGHKSVVKRGVVRLVTPGTLTEDSLLEARRNNFLCAYNEVRSDGAIAWVDISTGEVCVLSCKRSRLSPELARLLPKEVLIADVIERDCAEIVSDIGGALTVLGASTFDSTRGKERLMEAFAVASLDAFGTFNRAELGALGAIIDYLDITQKGNMPLLQRPIREDEGGLVQIDTPTRRNLEITTSMNGGRDGTLLQTIDRTVTSAGGRLLERRINAPSRDVILINDRLDAVAHFLSDPLLRDTVREALRKCPDIERALSRISLDRSGPRDLAAIRNGLQQAEDLFTNLPETGLPSDINTARTALSGHGELVALLDDALIAEPPLLARDGGFIAEGYDAELDEARKLNNEGRSVIASMQADFAEQTGISSLKIKHNNVLGYFIETTALHAEKMLSAPWSETFIHRQTTANAVRFTTVELSDLETRILNAGGRALEIEKRVYSSLTSAILETAATVSTTSTALAELDVFAALADIASGEGWTRPTVDTSGAFEIEQGRHPVVERSLKAQNAAFVANDCTLTKLENTAAVWLLTGPNMAGKSTFLRQNALIALMAQMGSFVPAARAHIGAVSQLFSRVGASDDLARGRSTFMVEMVETAAILNQADDRALVILDEIGRGTATYDGLSIAWSTLEYLHDQNKCRALFATHYHEMTQLADKMDGVSNATVAVREHGGDVIFLHEVRKGAADRSYGVQVAKLAGLPPMVIARAQSVLEALEKGEHEGTAGQKAIVDDLPLFSATPASPALTKEKANAVEAALAEILPDEMSPRDALDALYQLKALTKPA
jgi:DNA mismatch repair protein MutS